MGINRISVEYILFFVALCSKPTQGVDLSFYPLGQLFYFSTLDKDPILCGDALKFRKPATCGYNNNSGGIHGPI